VSWFAGRGASADTAVAQLFCLPFAGGGAAAYRAWPPDLPASIELLPVQLPGRERRLADDPDFAIADVAEAISRRADRPFALYGHSMGGRIAFEVVRELRRTGRPLPVLLAVGGTRAPHLPTSGVLSGVSALPDDEMFAALTEAGGTPAELLEHRELMTLFAPMVRADFRRLDEYVFTEEPPLPVPIDAFHGSDDELVTPEDVAAWQRHTSAAFAMHEVPGSHFFLREGQRVRLLQRLAKRLLDLT
jgi:surfactin synthase thioesterase subunit